MKTQMPFNNEIEKTKKEIEVLTAKLALLKEMENHKTPCENAFKDWWGQYPETGTWDGFDEKRWQGFQAGYEFAYAISTAKEVMEKVQEEQQKLEEKEPDMMLLRQGKVDVVDYDGKKYFRIEYTDSFADAYSWYVRRFSEDVIRPVRDVNLYAPLEELYQKEVVKQKEDYPYKKYTPEETEQSLKKAFHEAVKQGVVSSVEKPKTLYQICMEWWDDVFVNEMDNDICVDALVSKIDKEFIPPSSEKNGYEWEKCLKIMKNNLR